MEELVHKQDNYALCTEELLHAHFSTWAPILKLPVFLQSFISACLGVQMLSGQNKHALQRAVTPLYHRQVFGV